MSVQRRVCIGPWLIISIAPNSLSLTTSLHPQQTHLSVLSIPPTWKKHLCTLLPPPSVRNSDPGLRSKHPPPPLRCMPSFFSREGLGTILPRRLMSKCAYKRYYRRFQRVKLRTKKRPSWEARARENHLSIAQRGRGSQDMP